jgi:hypothetical protein
MATVIENRVARFGPRLQARLRAGGVHLGCCLIIAALVLALVFLCWYPSPLDQISGVGTILVIMLGADVALGPLITLIIYDRGKKNLRFDLSVVVTVQLLALAYGLYTVHEGRPSHLVFVKDRFEVIAPADIEIQDRAAAADNPSAARDLLRAKFVAARMPVDARERQTILFEALERGKDVQHHPRLYEPYSHQAQSAAARAQPLEALRRFNPHAADEIEKLPQALGVAPEMLRYLPLKGPQRDGAVVVHAESGKVLRLLALQPW